jgi:hypothetical protein
MVTVTSTDPLQELADRLTARGLRVRPDRPIGRPPALRVGHPASGTTESVFLEDQALWWSWGDLLAAASDPDTAAEGICRVLGAQPSLVP